MAQRESSEDRFGYEEAAPAKEGAHEMKSLEAHAAKKNTVGVK